MNRFALPVLASVFAVSLLALAADAWYVPALITLAVSFAGMAAYWVLCCVAEYMRGPADVGGCPWCAKPSYGSIAYGPEHCTCEQACGVVWCQLYPVTAELTDDAPEMCGRCGGPLPGLFERWLSPTEADVYCTQACADGGDRA